MESHTYVLPILVAVLIFHACGWASVTDARDDADIMARLAALEKGQRESQAEIRALRETVAGQKDTIEKQTAKLRTIQQDVITLKASQHRQFKRFQRTERLLQSLLKAGRRKVEVHRYDGTSETGPSVNQDNDGKERHHGIRKDQHIRGIGLKKREVENVAFTAYLDHDVVLGDHQVVKYNKVITNEGGGYNPNTGIFTCVLEGMYVFFFAVGERDAHQEWVTLRVNSQNVVGAAAEAAHTYQDIQGGNVATYRLQQGDSVWVENRLVGNSHLEGDSTWRFTTFSGFYLYP